MNLINYINDKKITNKKLSNYTDWHVRQAVRAVLQNERKQIALMHIGEYNVYKLPGGGVEEGESLDFAFIREIKEETGCEAEKISNLGIYIEKRDEWKMFQISHCYFARVTKVGVIKLDEAEQKEKFTLHWVDGIKEAIKLVKSNKSDRYDDKYIKNRDLAILKMAKKSLIPFEYTRE